MKKNLEDVIKNYFVLLNKRAKKANEYFASDIYLAAKKEERLKNEEEYIKLSDEIEITKKVIKILRILR